MVRVIQEGLNHPIIGGVVVFLVLSICRLIAARSTKPVDEVRS